MAQKQIIEASNLLNAVKSWGNGRFALAPTTTTVTIATTDWSSLSCTKSVTGMTSSKIVLVSPAPASFTAYTDAGVRCSAQGSGTLSFACDSVPSSSVTANVIILG